MASSKEIVPLLPETLPEDFGEWDSEASAAPLPRNSGERKAVDVSGRTAKPHGQSDYLEAILASFEDTQRVWRSDSPARVYVNQLNEYTNLQREASPAPLPSSHSEREDVSTVIETPKPKEKEADRQATSPVIADKLRNEWPDVSEPVFAKPEESAVEPADGSSIEASHKLEAGQTTNEIPVAPSQPVAAKNGIHKSPEHSKILMREADDAVVKDDSATDPEVEGERKAARKKWVIVSAGSACSILLLLILMTSMGHHGAQAAAKQPVQRVPGATNPLPTMQTATLPLSQPSIQTKPAPATRNPQSTEDQPTHVDGGVNSARGQTQVSTKMMDEQLAAPRLIPHDARKQIAEIAPPPASLSPAGADGLGGNGTLGSVTIGHGQPVVKALPVKPIAISSGVATGMLIQKTQLTYPPIAKTARVSGTVVLNATISTTGTIKDLYVVDGPMMLRQSAMDAVRNWRYKPYKLNNEPTEVETTINVVFTLGD